MSCESIDQSALHKLIILGAEGFIDNCRGLCLESRFAIFLEFWFRIYLLKNVFFKAGADEAFWIWERFLGLFFFIFEVLCDKIVNVLVVTLWVRKDIEEVAGGPASCLFVLGVAAILPAKVFKLELCLLQLPSEFIFVFCCDWFEHLLFEWGLLEELLILGLHAHLNNSGHYHLALERKALGGRRRDVLVLVCFILAKTGRSRHLADRTVILVVGVCFCGFQCCLELVDKLALIG